MLDRVKILNLAHDTRRDMGHDEQHEDDDDQEPHLCEGTKPAKRSARIKRSEQQRSLVESETTPLTNQQHYEDTTNSLASTNHAGASPMLSPFSNHDEKDARFLRRLRGSCVWPSPLSSKMLSFGIYRRNFQ